MDYAVDVGDLPPYLAIVNRLLQQRGFAPMTAGQLAGQINQLKVLIDLCHLDEAGFALTLPTTYSWYPQGQRLRVP